MFGKKIIKPGVTSKRFKGLGCMNCPMNRHKDKYLREDFLLSDNCFVDILFVLTSDNDRLFDLIEKHFTDKGYKIGITYLTKCEVPDLKPTSPEITCCKSQVVKEINKLTPKIIVGFNSHFVTWVYDIYYDARTWRGKLCPVKVGDKEVYQYTSLNYEIIEELKFYEQQEAWYQIEADFKNIKKHLKDYTRPVVWESGYENGIEIISGMEDGDLEKLKKELNHLAQLDYVAIDIENSPLVPWMKNKYYPDVTAIASIAIGTFDKTIAFPIEHPKCWQVEGEQDEVLELLEEFLIMSGTKICHNLKHELKWFYCYFGKEVLFETKWVDTQSLAYILNNVTSKEKNQGMFNLGKLTLMYYGFNVKNEREIDFKKMFDEPVKDLLTYNGRDTKWEHKLFFDMMPYLDENQKRLFDFHNQDCITFAIAESEGYLCNYDKLIEFEEEFESQVKTIEKKIFSLPKIKDKFDIASPQQLAEVLIDKYNVKLPKSAKGNYTTDADTLKGLKDNPLAPLVLDYRAVTKKLSTYITGIKAHVHVDSHFHSEFQSHFTKTGRKSCVNPNGQNFPKRKGKEVRRIVVPEKGCVIVSIDFGQLEARGYSFAAKEYDYIEKIKNGTDIHMAWAKRIIELYPDARLITNEKDLKVYRGDVKNQMVFPSFYGAGINSRAYSLNLPIQIMEQINDEFWVEFPNIKKWQEEQLEFYREHGYLETLTGRKLKGKVDEKSQYVIMLSTNDVCNYPIQSVCSDIVGDAANRLSKLSYEIDEPCLNPILNIHDDLTFTQVPERNADEYIQIMMKEMCRQTFDFYEGCPLQVEVSIGKNWCDMEEIYVKDTRDFKYD